jgi:plastocyanin
MPNTQTPFLSPLRNARRSTITAWIAVLLLAICESAFGETADVTLRIDFASRAGNHRPEALPEVVAWLTPSDGDPPSPSSPPHTYRMVQKGKKFTPHLLVIPIGAIVQFPNEDPFFHNVFSLYNGKRFDLGLYEAGSKREVRFDREGVSYIFCNIHPEMGAVILVLPTPFYADSRGSEIRIQQVPPGKYTLNVWSEGATTESLNSARRRVTINPATTDLGYITLTAAPSPVLHHTNKFGEAYPPAAERDGSSSPY